MRLRVAGSGEEADVEAVPAELPRGVAAVRDGNAVWVAAHGETYRVERVVVRPGRRHADVEHDLRAPMPGKILGVYVEEGADVTRGTPLLTLEAMKMEHEIKAPRDGKVVKLSCRAGEMVGLGDVLVEIE